MNDTQQNETPGVGSIGRKLRIAMICTLPAWGGSEELWAAGAESALRRGHSMRAWMYRGVSSSRLDQLTKLGLEISRRRFVNLGRFARLAAPFVRGFADLGKYRPDVVCFTQPNTYAVVEMPDVAAPLQYVRQARVPHLVISQWNSGSIALSDGQRDRARDVFTAADRVLFVAERNLITARRQLAHPIANAIVVQNPVNLRDVSTVAWPATSVDAPARFASVARLSVQAKGQDLLMEILGKPAWRDRAWHLTLYGKGPDEAYIRRLVEFYGLAGRVTLRGQVEDIRALWAAEELLLMPSRNEGTPLALVEAQLCGRPAVVSDVGGNTERVTEGVSGFVAEGCTVRSFGAAMERAWQSRQSWKQLGEAARVHALPLYDSDVGGTLVRHLEEIAAAATSGGRP